MKTPTASVTFPMAQRPCSSRLLMPLQTTCRMSSSVELTSNMTVGLVHQESRFHSVSLESAARRPYVHPRRMESDDAAVLLEPFGEVTASGIATSARPGAPFDMARLSRGTAGQGEIAARDVQVPPSKRPKTKEASASLGLLMRRSAGVK